MRLRGKIIWPVLLVVLLTLLAGVVLARLRLAGWALRRGLTAAGATDVSFKVTQASLGTIGVADLGLQWRHVPVRAARVTLVRDHPLQASLGRLHVSGLQAEVSLADVARLSELKSGGGATGAPAAPAKIPLDGISVDGRVLIRTGAGDQAISLTFAAEPVAAEGVRQSWHWQGLAKVAAPGLTASLTGDYDFQAQAGTFTLESAQINLAQFRDFVNEVRPLPMPDWTVGGNVELSGGGAWRDGKLTAHGELRLRDGQVANIAQKVAVDSMALDMKFIDLAALETLPAQPVSVAKVTLGQVTLTAINARVQVAGAHEVRVEGATAEAFGGKLSLAPFQLDPSRVDYAFTVGLAGLDLSQLQPLLPAQIKQARGLIDGIVPVRYDASGLHFGRGWLRLQGGTPAYLLCLYPDGMLTQSLGIDPRFAAYPALKEVEEARLPMRVSALSVELHPPGGPADRYASIHLEGSPDDPKQKVPISLDLNLNGPVEALINWGLNTRLHVGNGP